MAHGVTVAKDIVAVGSSRGLCLDEVSKEAYRVLYGQLEPETKLFQTGVTAALEGFPAIGCRFLPR